MYIIFFIIDLLHISGITQSTVQSSVFSSAGDTNRGMGNLNRNKAASGSEILEKNAHDLRLEKSNIMMLGPTGSGKQIKILCIIYSRRY